jgi:hypothetical protein
MVAPFVRIEGREPVDAASTVTLKDNDLSFGYGKPVIVQQDLQGGIQGVASEDLEIADNSFESLCWDAVLGYSACDMQIIRNRIVGGRLTGMQLRNCETVLIEGNLVAGHKTEAVLLDLDTRGVEIRRNRFEGNRGLAVSNETENTVIIEGNWWDSPSGLATHPSDAGECCDPEAHDRSPLTESPDLELPPVVDPMEELAGLKVPLEPVP